MSPSSSPKQARDDIPPKEAEQVEQLMGPRPDEIPAKGEEPEVTPEVPPLPSGVIPPEGVSEPEQPPEAEAQPSTPAIDAAVDDITHHESDAVLEAEDAKLTAAFTPHKTGFFERIKNAVWQWWHNKKARYITLAGLGALILGLLLFPMSRYAAMNTIGIRVKANVVVIDSKSLQPLKNITVHIGSVSSTTDHNGKAVLSGLKQGKQRLVLEKRAFAALEKDVTLGWGDNQLGSFNLVSTGVRYTFITTDLLSGKPIPKIEAKYNDAVALGDSKGTVVLTVDPGDTKELEITLTDTNQTQQYRTETIKISADAKEVIKKTMVPQAPHYFISKRSGKYDLYQVSVDGKNEKLILSGTGKERDDINLTVSPGGTYVALVSTRDDQHNSDGFALSGLYMLNSKDAVPTPKKITQSEQVQIVGWLDGRLIYVKIAEGTSTASPSRNKLMSYDPSQDKAKELASSNYFNDVVIANNKLFYAPSNAYNDNPQAFLFQVDSDGSNKKTLLDKEVWNLFRTDYSTFLISTAQQTWYTYTIGSSAAPKAASTQPTQPTNRLYIQSESAKALWVDQRDGKGVLLNYDSASKKDTTLATMSGLQYPVYWLNESYVVFRVKTPTESADYVVSTEGGEPRKISDVADTNGIDRWYYY